MCLQYKYFENAMGKEKIAHNEQFLLFSKCFPTLGELSTILIKSKIVICKLFKFGSLKFVI